MLFRGAKGDYLPKLFSPHYLNSSHLQFELPDGDRQRSNFPVSLTHACRGLDHVSVTVSRLAICALIWPTDGMADLRMDVQLRFGFGIGLTR